MYFQEVTGENIIHVLCMPENIEAENCALGLRGILFRSREVSSLWEKIELADREDKEDSERMSTGLSI